MERDMKRTIVVGVDGSEGGRRALEWAIEQARLAGMALELVHGVDVGMSGSSPFGTGMVFEQLEDAGKELLELDLELARAAGVTADGHLDLGSSAQALLAASKGAAMLVVGSRGHGSMAGLLLGSISTACVHHAHCPVVVVPPPT